MAKLISTHREDGRFHVPLYEEKIARLKGIISQETRTLQNLTEAKEEALRQLEGYRETQATLISRIYSKVDGLEKELADARTQLVYEIERRTAFIDSAKAERVREEGALKAVKQEIRTFSKEAESLHTVVRELSAFVARETEARARYLAAQGILEHTRAESAAVSAETEARKAGIEKKNAELDDYRTNLHDLSNRLTTSLNNVKQCAEAMNESLEEYGSPIRFALPQKVVTIPF